MRDTHFESNSSDPIESLSNETASAPLRSSRIVSIDALRGLVMVLMALDHSRDFFGDLRIRPEDVESTTIALFFTRWVTHFCAPTFVFLAGVSAWMYGRKLKSRTELSKFLVSRGLWLIFLEFTVVYFGLYFTFSLGAWTFLVIAAIGASMILLGLICWLPHQWVLIIGIGIVSCHNLLDPIEAASLGELGWIWVLFHERGYIEWANVVVGYPVLPWFGLMAVGYGIGPFLNGSSAQRRRFALVLGVALVAAFALLRCLNQYGDSQRWDWQPQSKSNVESQVGSLDPSGEVHDSHSATSVRDIAKTDWTRTVFSFLATSKYPPSLLFVLMTIGPAMIILAGLEWLGDRNFLVRFLNVYGRVPLFFYMLHFYLLHLGALALYWIAKGVLISPMQRNKRCQVPYLENR